MTPLEREKKIERLLLYSKFRGRGLHGRTINVVMGEVQKLRFLASLHKPARISVPIRRVK
jgi:hypothetical protein